MKRRRASLTYLDPSEDCGVLGGEQFYESIGRHRGMEAGREGGSGGQ